MDINNGYWTTKEINQNQGKIIIKYEIKVWNIRPLAVGSLGEIIRMSEIVLSSHETVV